MRTAVCVLFVTIASVALADEKSELRKLKGNWEITTLYIGGVDRMKVIREKKDGTTLQIQGNKITGFNGEMTFTLDDSKKPKWMDLTLQSGERTVKVPAIYEVAEDQLTILMSPAPTKPKDEVRRPAGFELESKAHIVVFHRKWHIE